RLRRSTGVGDTLIYKTSKLTPSTWLRATLLRGRASCVRTCPSGVAPRDWNAVFIPRGGVLLLALAISSLLLVDAVVASAPLGGPGLDLDEEDLSFLEEEVGVAVSHEDKGSADNADDSYSGSDESEYDDQDQYEAFDDLGHGSHNTVPTIDETDVVVLTDGNFSDFLEKHRHMMVEFYAPEYAAATTALRGEDVVLAKVDATEENELAQRFEVNTGVLTFSTLVCTRRKRERRERDSGRNRGGKRRNEEEETWRKKRKEEEEEVMEEEKEEGRRGGSIRGKKYLPRRNTSNGVGSGGNDMTKESPSSGGGSSLGK
ncbi:hypothetical protein B296_00022442, partial [Ensete ventricosum]